MARRRTTALRVTEEATREAPGLRERKKARLRRQIIETAIKLFRKHGYENTRVEDIVRSLDISQPTFFRYFPTKDAVLRDLGSEAMACITQRLETELSTNATTTERLRRLYLTMAQDTEADRPLWQAVVLADAMNPVRSPDFRGPEQVRVRLLREIFVEGQRRGEITSAFPADHLVEFIEALYIIIVRRWAVDLIEPHSLTERVGSALEFFLRGSRP